MTATSDRCSARSGSAALGPIEASAAPMVRCASYKQPCPARFTWLTEAGFTSAYSDFTVPSQGSLGGVMTRRNWDRIHREDRLKHDPVNDTSSSKTSNDRSASPPPANDTQRPVQPERRRPRRNNGASGRRPKSASASLRLPGELLKSLKEEAWQRSSNPEKLLAEIVSGWLKVNRHQGGGGRQSAGHATPTPGIRSSSTQK